LSALVAGLARELFLAVFVAPPKGAHFLFLHRAERATKATLSKI
jgi:hypothetical protein